MEHRRRCSMPWRQTSPMDQRIQFISDFLRHSLSITDLCDLYGVSRKTGYKWIDRYLRLGPEGLVERSRRPACAPNATSQEIVGAFIEVRQRHPSWGAKKLLRSCINAIRAGICPAAPQSVTSSSVMEWCPKSAIGVISAIPASPPARSLHPTRYGVPTSRDSSKQAMDITVIHWPV